MSAAFERGATARAGDIVVAFALPATAGAASKQTPDLWRFFVRRGDDWALVDLRTVAATIGPALPLPLRSSRHFDAHATRLQEAARYLARLPANRIPTLSPPPRPARCWWLDHQQDQPQETSSC